MSVGWWYMRPCLTLVVIIIIFKLTISSMWLAYQDPTSLPHGDGTLPSRHGLQIHGDESCYDSYHEDEALLRLAEKMRRSCEGNPTSTFTRSPVRVGKLATHLGSHSTVYNRAIRSHHVHSMVHGMATHIICSPAVRGMWNKPAFVLSVLLNEMVKPEGERLEWLMWTDRDSLVLDPCRNPAAFLPPPSSSSSSSSSLLSSEINLLATLDFNGLNDGVFLVRVCPWAIDLFADLLSFPRYRPSVTLPFTHQSILERLLRDEERYRSGVRYVPQHWFNAYPLGTAGLFAGRDDGAVAGMAEDRARRGDFIVHFAGDGDKEEWIGAWDEMLAGLRDVWTEGTWQRNTTGEIAGFWAGHG